MRACIRFLLLLAATAASVPGVAAAQASPGAPVAQADLSPATRADVLRQFRVLVIRDGVVLTPRRGEEKSIEIANGSIAVDGESVSGRELREQLGADADLVIQLSYASPEALRAAFAPPHHRHPPRRQHQRLMQRHPRRPPFPSLRRRQRRIASGGARAAQR